MAVFGPYTQPVKPAEWVDPLDLNMYAKGMMYKQEMAEKNLKSIVDTHNTLMSLPAYGPDKQKLAEIDQQFRQQLGSMNISNLGDMSTMSQVKGVLGQYTTNADVLAIAQRGSIYKSMLEEKEAADKKNKIYVNRGMSKLNKYFNGEEYIQNLKFGNDGYTAPDAAEIMEGVKKFITPDVKLVSDGRGNYQQMKYYDPEKVKNAFNMVTESNPNWQKYHRDQVDEMLEDKNVTEYGQQYYNNFIEKYQTVYDQALMLRDKTTDKRKAAEYQKVMDQYSSEIANVQKKIQNPYFETAFRSELVNKSIQDDISNMSDAIEFTEMGDYKMDDATKMSRQYGYDTLKMQQKEFYELMPYMTQEDRAKIGTGRQNEIDLPGYKQFMDQSKAKAAAIALNPNLANTEIIKGIGGTYKEITDLISQADSEGNKTIVNSPLAQQKIVDIIKARPELFPNISPEIIKSLKPNDIEISDNEIEIDQTTGWSTTYSISQADLIKAVQDTYDKNIGSVNPLDAANQSIMNATGATGLDAAAE
jgi:hypothetical protein